MVLTIGRKLVFPSLLIQDKPNKWLIDMCPDADKKVAEDIMEPDTSPK